MEKLFEYAMTGLMIGFVLSLFNVNTMITDVCRIYLNFEFTDSLYYILLLVLGVCVGLYENKKSKK